MVLCCKKARQGGLMHCVYCGVEYSLEDACLCLPRLKSSKLWSSEPRVEGPWGEAAREWSVAGEEFQLMSIEASGLA
jgi:hypothetical protein